MSRAPRRHDRTDGQARRLHFAVSQRSFLGFPFNEDAYLLNKLRRPPTLQEPVKHKRVESARRNSSGRTNTARTDYVEQQARSSKDRPTR
jgi:hypothetical protein